MPHFLKGTILDGSKKVIATEDGKLPEDLRKFIKEKGVNFIAPPDHGYYCQYCVMCYSWARLGVNHWCPWSQDTIDEHMGLIYVKWEELGINFLFFLI